MGMVFGKICVETPKFEVIETTTDYEIRKYSPSVVAEITYNPTQFQGDRDGGFTVLANYIGVFGQPKNTKPEKIAMTTPVITRKPETDSEKIAMTTPVITRKPETDSEKIAMTTPVVTKSGGDYSGGVNKMVSMQFVLPSKYTKAEEAPVPIDERVVIKEVKERKCGVVKFSGVATDKVVEARVDKLKKSLERDGYKVIGEFLLARYNPPWTLPAFRTNEIMVPIEF